MLLHIIQCSQSLAVPLLGSAQTHAPYLTELLYRLNLLILLQVGQFVNVAVQEKVVNLVGDSLADAMDLESFLSILDPCRISLYGIDCLPVCNRSPSFSRLLIDDQ